MNPKEGSYVAGRVGPWGRGAPGVTPKGISVTGHTERSFTRPRGESST